MSANIGILKPGNVVEVPGHNALGVFIRYTGSRYVRALVLLDDGHSRIVNTDSLKLAPEETVIYLAGKSWRNREVQTIDITAKEWFDKVNGNSYFSAKIVVDYGMGTEKTFFIPFQYGYRDYYVDVAELVLVKKGLIREGNHHLSFKCQDAGIILRTTKHDNCLKRDVVAFGKGKLS